MEDLLQVGVITSTHGIKGEVKVFPTTDDVNRFKKLNSSSLSSFRGNTRKIITNAKPACSNILSNICITSFPLSIKDLSSGISL